MLPTPEINFKRTPVTLIIIAMAAALELVCTIDGSQRAYHYNDLRLGVLSPIWNWELWRPLTTTLLHGGFIHAAFNSYWMLVFGAFLEHRFGSYRFLGMVVLLAYVSTMPQFIVSNYTAPVDAQVGCVGLSGIIYGLFGFLWIGRRHGQDFYAVCNDATVQLFLVWFVICIILTRTNILPVGNIAHGAGAVFGVLYGLATLGARGRRQWLCVATIATALVLSTLVACPGHAGYEHSRRLRQLKRQLQVQIETLQQGPAEGRENDE